MVEIRVLGTLSVRGPDGRDLDALLAQPKRLALLAYLALATPRGFHRRDTLVGLFWPESDEAHARGALRKALHVLRRTVGDDVILSRGEEEVGVDFNSVTCDAVVFQDAVESRRLEDAMALYRGELLPGFFLDDAPEFERWLERERSRLRGLAASVAQRLTEEFESAGRFADAVTAARSATELAGTDERQFRRLLELLDRVGDRAGAISAYDEFARQVARIAGVEPSAQTQELVQRIRERRSAPVATASAAGRSEGGTTAEPNGVEASSSPAVSRSGVSQTEERPSRAGALGTVARMTSVRSRFAAVVILAALVGGSMIALGGRGSRADVSDSRKQLTFVGNVMNTAASPDGQFLAYTVPRSDSELVVVQDVAAGGRPDTVARVARALTMDWSPDGSRVLVTSFGQAFVISRTGGTVRRLRLPSLPGPAVRASWHPDGRRISVHVPSDRKVHLLDLTTETTTAIPVSGTYAWLLGAAWAPGGREFAIMTASGTSDSTIVHLVAMDGRRDLLVQDSVRLSSPRWSAGGDTLYYVREDGLWRVPVSVRSGRTREAPQKVTDQLDLLGPLDERPKVSISRDGDVTYLKGRHFSNLLLVDAAAPQSSPRQLTTGTVFRWGVTVSPDGKSIALAQQTRDGAELFRMPVSGGEPEQVTFGARVVPMTEVAWSPNGSELAFVSGRSGPRRVWIARVDDGQMRPLDGTSSSRAQGQLTWAPGHGIAYQTTDHHSLKLIDPTTGRQRIVASDARGTFHSPRFSPDGKRLAFDWIHAPSARVVVYNLADSSTITAAPRNLWPRAWSDDGRYIYAHDMRSIHRVDATGTRPPELIVALPWRNAQCSTVGAQHPNTFVCTTFDYVSDVWKMERAKR